MINHLLLDIEGTTCPVSFVTSVLFPYAKEQLEPFIKTHQNENTIKNILDYAQQEWEEDTEKQSQKLKEECQKQNCSQLQSIILYLRHLINIDRKSTALKDIQGIIWESGYKKGEFTSSLYDDALKSLYRWKSMPLEVSLYSSGSIKAQKLLYQHTQDGDLLSLFHNWFDTHIGSKKDPKSYEKIAKSLLSTPNQICFISDNADECDAAEHSGMETLFCRRSGNPDQNPRHHRSITSLHEVDAYVLRKTD